MAKSLPAVANRNLLRGEDATDRTPGVLGIHLAGAQEFVAFSEMDSGNGALRPSQAQGFLSLLPVGSGRRAFKDDIHFATFARSNDLRGGSAVGGNLQITHTPEDAEDLIGCALSIVAVNLSDLALADKDLESRRLCLKQSRNVLRREISDHVAEAVHFED